jgi:hypothetical protein
VIFKDYEISITFTEEFKTSLGLSDWARVRVRVRVYIDEKEEGGKKRSKRLYCKMRSIWDIGNLFPRNRKFFSYILDLTFPKIWIYYFLCPQGLSYQ